MLLKYTSKIYKWQKKTWNYLMFCGLRTILEYDRMHENAYDDISLVLM
jgi:hypothetical protein